MRLAVLLALACVGCGPILPPGGESGEIGEGDFFWECTSQTDPVCENELDPSSSFPQGSIALGSTFGVDFLRRLGDTPFHRVEPASHDMIRTVGSERFRAEKSGFVALLALSGDILIDITHVRIDEPDRLEIGLDGGTLAAGAAIELKELEDITLSATAVDTFGDFLAGSLFCQWSTDDDGIIELRRNRNDNDMEIQAIAPGTAKLSVELGELSAELTIVVEGVTP